MSTTTVANLIAKFGADTSGVKKGADDALGTLKDYASKALQVLSAAAIGKFLIGSLEAQGASEAGINKLNLALANQGRFTAGASKALQDYASELQDTTRYSDDAVKGVMATLASFGMAPGEIKKTTAAVADFAAATGTDLATAGNLMGKAFAGNTAMLGRYGILVDQNLPKTEQFASAMSQLNQRFGGSAKADAQSYGGQLEMLKNQYDEVKESVGKLLGELMGAGNPFEGIISGLKSLAKYVSQDLVIALSEARAQFAEFLAWTLDQASKVSNLGKGEGLGANIARATAGAFGVKLGEDQGGLKAMADDQRKLATELRMAGDAAAVSAGKLLTFKNAAGGARGPVVDLKKAAEELKKYLEALSQGMQAFFDQLATRRSAKEGYFDDLGQGAETAQFEMNRLTVKLEDYGGVAALSDSQAKALAGKLKELSDNGAKLSDDVLVALNDRLAGIADNLPTLTDGITGASDATLTWAQRLSILGDLAQGLGPSFSKFGTAVAGVGSAFEQLAKISPNGKGGVNFRNLFSTGEGGGMHTFGGKMAVGAAVGQGLSAVGGLFGQGSKAGNAFAGAAAGAQIGAIAGPYGMAIGAVVGGIVGFLKKDPIKKAGKDIAQALGHSVSREFAKQAMEMAQSLGISIKEAAKKIELEDLRAKAKANRDTLEGGVNQARGGAEALSGLLGPDSKLSETFKAASAPLIQAVQDALAANGMGFMATGKLAESPEFKAVQDAAGAIGQIVQGMMKAGGIDKDFLQNAAAATQALKDDAIAAAKASGLGDVEAGKAGIAAVAPLLRDQLNAAIASGKGIDSGLQKLLDEAKANGIDIVADAAYQQLDELRGIRKAVEGGGAGGAEPRGRGARPEGSPSPVGAAGGLYSHDLPDYGGGLGPLIQTHAHEQALIIPRGRKGAFFSAARGYGQDISGGDEGGGRGGGGGGTPPPGPAPPPVPSPEAIAAAVTGAVQRAVQQVARPITIAPTININEDPNATAQAREERRQMTVTTVADAFRSREAGLMIEARRALLDE